MNVFNRITMILLLMIIIVILAVIVISVLVFPAQVVEWAQQGAGILEDNLVPANRLMNRLAVFVIGGVSLIFCVLLLWLEIRRGRAKTITVQRISGGEAQLAIESIARRVEYNIKELADVVGVKPTVIRRGKGVEVQLDLETTPDIEVPMKTEEVCVVTREVVEDQMGLKLNNVKVNIRHAPFPKDKKKPWDWQRRELPRPVDLPVGEPEELMPVYTAPVAEVEEEEIIEAEVEEVPPAPPILEERLGQPEATIEEMIAVEEIEEEKPSLSPFARLKNLFVKETPAPAPEEELFEPTPFYPYEEAEVKEVIVTPPPYVPAVEVEEEPIPYDFEVEQEIEEAEVITPVEEAEEAEYPPFLDETVEVEAEAAEPEEAMLPSDLAAEEETEYPTLLDETVEEEAEEAMLPSDLAAEEEAEYPPFLDETVEEEAEEAEEKPPAPPEEETPWL